MPSNRLENQKRGLKVKNKVTCIDIGATMRRSQNMKKVIAALLTLLVIVAVIYLPYGGGLIADQCGLYTGQSWFSIWGYGLTFLVMGTVAIATGLVIILFISVIIYCVYESMLDLIGG